MGGGDDSFTFPPFGGFPSTTNPNCISGQSQPPVFGFASPRAPTFMSTESANDNTTTATATATATAFGSSPNNVTFAPLHTSSSQPAIFAPPSNSVFGFGGTATQASPSLFASSTTPPPPPTTTFGCGLIMPNANNQTRPAYAVPASNYNSIFKLSTATTATVPSFDFSSTPLFCFANIPSSFPVNYINPAASSSLFAPRSSPLEVAPLFKEPTSIPTLHVCKTCGTKSFKEHHCGSKMVAYTQTPEDYPTFKTYPPLMITSISAMPIFENKSPDELRWEDFQSQGKTQVSFAPANESTTTGQRQVPVAPSNKSSTFGQTQLVALPVFMLAVMPTSSSFCGFNVLP